MERGDFLITDDNPKLMVIKYKEPFSQRERKSIIYHASITNEISRIIKHRETHLFYKDDNLKPGEKPADVIPKKTRNTLSNKFNLRFQTFTKSLIQQEGYEGITPKTYRIIMKFAFHISHISPQALEKMAN